jgi:serine/threonine protein kinase
LGCILFNLRYPAQLFFDWLRSDARSTAMRMYSVLGDLPQEWLTVPFYNGYPAEGPLDAGVQPQTITLINHPDVWSLEQFVDHILEPRRPANSSKKPRTGLEHFCLPVPFLDYEDVAGKAKFDAENTTPIRKEDAKLFVDLLRKIFDYDHTKRITASQILEHPWMREAGQKPHVASALTMGVHSASLPFRANHPKTTSQACQKAVQKATDTQAPSAQHPVRTATTTVDKKKAGARIEKRGGAPGEKKGVPPSQKKARKSK